MAKQVEPATASGSMAGPAGSSAGAGAGAAAQADGQEVVPFVSQVPGMPVSFPSFHGRPVSWVAVSLIMFAFLLGGLALVIGPTWWLFWTALGIAAFGGLLALATGIFNDWY
jgi:hypothetical protein